MKFVVTSDWHGDWVTDGFDRDADLESVLDNVLREAVSSDAFLFLGDLSNPYSRNVHKASAIAVSFATELSRLGVPNYWLAGNHDIIESGDAPYTSLHALRGVGGETVLIERPMTIPFGQSRQLVAMPYVSPSFAYDPREFVRAQRELVQDESRVIVAGHLNLEGIGPGSETIDMPRGRDVFWPFEEVEACLPNAVYLNGHYHEQQVFRNVHIPGSPLRLTHGEELNEPGFLVLEI